MIENLDYLNLTAKEKLDRFQTSIFEEATAKAEEIIQQAHKTAAQILKSSEDTVLNNCFEQISTKSKEIKQGYEKLVSHKSFEANKAVLQHRNQLIETFFNEIKQDIIAYTSTEQYTSFLLNLLKKVNEKKPFDSGVTFIVKPEDVERINELSKGYEKTQVKPDSTIKLGGILFRYEKDHVSFDKTLDRQFEEQKQSFVTREELRL